jgi:membrane protein involved in colicin uptake
MKIIIRQTQEKLAAASAEAARKAEAAGRAAQKAIAEADAAIARAIAEADAAIARAKIKAAREAAIARGKKQKAAKEAAEAAAAAEEEVQEARRLAFARLEAADAAAEAEAAAEAAAEAEEEVQDFIKRARKYGTDVNAMLEGEGFEIIGYNHKNYPVWGRLIKDYKGNWMKQAITMPSTPGNRRRLPETTKKKIRLSIRHRYLNKEDYEKQDYIVIFNKVRSIWEEEEPGQGAL